MVQPLQKFDYMDKRSLFVVPWLVTTPSAGQGTRGCLNFRDWLTRKRQDYRLTTFHIKRWSSRTKICGRYYFIEQRGHV